MEDESPYPLADSAKLGLLLAWPRLAGDPAQCDIVTPSRGRKVRLVIMALVAVAGHASGALSLQQTSVSAVAPAPPARSIRYCEPLAPEPVFLTSMRRFSIPAAHETVVQKEKDVRRKLESNGVLAVKVSRTALPVITVCGVLEEATAIQRGGGGVGGGRGGHDGGGGLSGGGGDGCGGSGGGGLGGGGGGNGDGDGGGGGGGPPGGCGGDGGDGGGDAAAAGICMIDPVGMMIGPLPSCTPSKWWRLGSTVAMCDASTPNHSASGLKTASHGVVGMILPRPVLSGAEALRSSG